MSRSRRHLTLVLGLVLALGGGVVVATRARDEAPLATDESRSSPPPLAVPPAASDLRAPPAETRRGHGTRGDSATATDTKATAGAVVARRIRVRLADGRPATEGVVIWCDPTSQGSHPPASDGVLATARIGPDGIATLLLDAGDEARSGTLLVAVPGQPNVVPVAYGTLAAESLDVSLPRGVAFTGTVTDGDGRPVPDLAILVTSKATDDNAVFDEDLGLSLVAEGPILRDFVHVEARTDASGRFAVRVPSAARGDVTIVRVRSLDPRWYVATTGTFLAGESPTGPNPAAVRVQPGVVLDVRAHVRDGPDANGDAYLRLAHVIDLGPQGTGAFAFGAATKHATNHVRVLRNGPRDRPSAATLVLTADGASPALARVTIPAGLDETRIDLVLDRADDAEHTGLVELTVAERDGVAGRATPWSLEVATSEPPVLRVDILDITTWAAADRLDARLAPGRWRLRLLPEGRHSVAYEAVVDVAARVTTRVAMARPAPETPGK